MIEKDTWQNLKEHQHLRCETETNEQKEKTVRKVEVNKNMLQLSIQGKYYSTEDPGCHMYPTGKSNTKGLQH